MLSIDRHNYTLHITQTCPQYNTAVTSRAHTAHLAGQVRLGVHKKSRNRPIYLFAVIYTPP